jgi:hypothetical protein
MPSVVRPQYPRRYRRVACGPEERANFLAEQNALLERARTIDDAQQTLAGHMADIRTRLAHIRVVMWPRVEPKDIVQGFRYTRVNGPLPIPPVAKCAKAVGGRDLRSAVLAILAQHGRPMSLVEIHRALHLDGYAMTSRFPVKRLADALAYETRKGRAFRVERGIYQLGVLTPRDRRELGNLPRNQQ